MATEMARVAPRGRVVLGGGLDRPRSQHEFVAHAAIARQLAALLDLEFAGPFDGRCVSGESTYFVPEDVLVGLDAAAASGIRGEADLFGGVVPHPVVATKAISHPCVRPGAFAPPGWSWAFAQAVEAVTLPGFAAFDRADAREAGRRLLAAGPVRVKPAHANAGRGQSVAADAAALDALVDGLDATLLRTHGVVLESDLVDPVTYSIGEVRVGGFRIAYHGRQWLTCDNRGERVYGGSELDVVRGGLAQLLATPLPPAVHAAVAHAHGYDQAARRHLPGMFASRRNYDVAQGRDHAGRPRMGVLESSWRIGGASSAEVAALVRLQAEPALRRLHVRAIELYGDDPALPEGAQVLYRGDDPGTGPITVCTVVEDHGDP